MGREARNQIQLNVRTTLYDDRNKRVSFDMTDAMLRPDALHSVQISNQPIPRP
jgi:hypothetical protein